MKTLIAVVALVASLPDAYTVQFENEWVRVTRVVYPPYAKLPGHAHTPLASAYVYLNDAGPVIFRHVGEKEYSATRPATRAGSFRVFRGIDEIHEVENTSEVPSEFLRVEFKTEPRGVATLRGRFHREPVAPGETVEKVQFENEQVRITRLNYAQGSPLRVVTTSEPVLLIELTSGAGTARWIPAGRSETLESDLSGPREMLRFDFKTGPLRPDTQNR